MTDQMWPAGLQFDTLSTLSKPYEEAEAKPIKELKEDSQGVYFWVLLLKNIFFYDILIYSFKGLFRNFVSVFFTVAHLVL